MCEPERGWDPSLRNSFSERRVDQRPPEMRAVPASLLGNGRAPNSTPWPIFTSTMNQTLRITHQRCEKREDLCTKGSGKPPCSNSACQSSSEIGRWIIPVEVVNGAPTPRPTLGSQWSSPPARAPLKKSFVEAWRDGLEAAPGRSSSYDYLTIYRILVATILRYTIFWSDVSV